MTDIICVNHRVKQFVAKQGQALCKCYFKNDIVFGIGPAGTGKTYLAMAMAVTAFRASK